jgi:hypothetical protein
MATEECTGDRLDWDKLIEQPMVAGGFVLVISGVAPKPMTVCLRLSPPGTVEEDYRQIEVLGTANDIEPQVETPWHLDITNIEDYYGRVGVELVGATKRAQIPSKDS